jgi:hypothetical protein
MIEFPKWVYFTDGPQESYAEGFAPVLVESAEDEAALTEDAPMQFPDEPVVRRGRPRKAADYIQVAAE